jgi:glycosyltransferase involved in cell wall biosynthesis
VREGACIRDRLGAAMRGGVVLVHDYLLVLRGAERTFASMAECWPEAPIFTLLYDEEGTGGVFAGRDVRPSYLQRLRSTQAGFRRMLPLFPRAAESLPVGSFDLVVSSSSAFAHGVRPAPDAIHVCYCHSPFRYVWHERRRALAEVPARLRPAFDRWLDRVQRWDRRAAERVDHYIANSELTRRRIQDYWGRDARVVHPPVDVDLHIGEPEDYLLIVGELVAHKRVDVALEAARRAGRRVKVVGTGPLKPSLERRFEDTAEFFGRVSDYELADLYAGALALVVPNVEEFGIAAVEAQAAGRPVLAIDAGGTRETVVPGETGILVDVGTVEDFAEAMREVDFTTFDPEGISLHAQAFSSESFQERLVSEVDRLAAVAVA